MTKKRPDELSGKTIRIKTTQCGTLFVTVNWDETNRPVEVFARLGKGGGCGAAQCEAIGRVVALYLQDTLIETNEAVGRIVKALTGIQCHSPNEKIKSCADGIGKALEVTFGKLNEHEKEK